MNLDGARCGDQIEFNVLCPKTHPHTYQSTVMADRSILPINRFILFYSKILFSYQP